MGFFSWICCDQAESVANVHTGMCKTVHLLQPNGKPVITEEAYEGYGYFGDVNAYIWLIENNANHLGIDLAGAGDDTKYAAGVCLAVGYVCEHRTTGELWCYAPNLESVKLLFSGSFKPPVINTFDHWGAIIPAFDATANNMVESGWFERKQVSELLGVRYPIKLSFNPEARYENHPASAECPNQGFFM